MKKPRKTNDSVFLSSDCAESWRVFRIMAEFVEGFETLAVTGPAVTIFGSARTRPDDAMYRAAEQTARMLARKKFAVITGGGPGIMEAGNKGAFEAGGKSIGLNISLPHEQQSNKYQTISLDFHYFYARKVMFVKYAAAFICFPGGYGTLDEFFETITLIQTMKIEAFPIILYGKDYWSGLVNWLRSSVVPHFADTEDLDIFRVVDSPREAVQAVTQGVRKHWWKPADKDLQKCINCEPTQTPLHGELASTTGEGTRYGKRPQRPDKAHLDAPKKPTQ